MSPFTTLYDVLAGFLPDSDALILTACGTHLSRSSLLSSVIDTALALRSAGVQPGDVVSMAYANTVCAWLMRLLS